MSESEPTSAPETTLEPEVTPTPDPVADSEPTPDSEPASAPETEPTKVGRPRAPSPAAIAARKTRVVLVPALVEIDPKVLKAATKHALVEDGVVILLDGDTRHEVGPAAGDEPLVPYVRKYLDHLAALERFHDRLEQSDLSMKDIDSGLAAAEGVLTKPDFVGDAAAYRKRLGTIAHHAGGLRDAMAREREEVRAAAVAAREQLVTRAEAIAAKSPDAIHWKSDTAELRGLLEAWKEAQQSAVRIGKDVEKALWQRFAHARSSFEKTRKHHFAELDHANASVSEVKEKLAARAEALITSTAWENTARELRDLMHEWKTAGRGRKTSDDALWSRFQAAQDAFFEARRVALESERSHEETSLALKEALVKEAEGLLPVRDVAAAKAALHSIHDRFEAIGRVPKSAVPSLGRRLSAVERAVRDADQAAWTARNPEVEARVSDAAQKLVSAIADLNADIEKATAEGKGKVVEELTEARNARQAWLDQIQGQGS